MGLLWDATRGLIRTFAQRVKALGIAGCRQHKKRTQNVYTAFQAVRTARQYRSNRKGVKAYLRVCRTNGVKARILLKRLDAREAALRARRNGGPPSEEDTTALAALSDARAKITGFLDYVTLFADQVKRRILNGEEIPHKEKVFSIFKPYTRCISKGKAGGVRVGGSGGGDQRSVSVCFGP